MTLVTRTTFEHMPHFGSMPKNVEVADFTGEVRPAYRVECHCRNCNWKGEARMLVGVRIPQWLLCPKCEVEELSAHGKFLGRDELTRAEDQEKITESLKKQREYAQERRDYRDSLSGRPIKPIKPSKRGRLGGF